MGITPRSPKGTVLHKESSEPDHTTRRREKNKTVLAMNAAVGGVDRCPLSVPCKSYYSIAIALCVNLVFEATLYIQNGVASRVFSRVAPESSCCGHTTGYTRHGLTRRSTYFMHNLDFRKHQRDCEAIRRQSPLQHQLPGIVWIFRGTGCHRGPRDDSE